jgi:hypothetical protein
MAPNETSGGQPPQRNPDVGQRTDATSVIAGAPRKSRPSKPKVRTHIAGKDLTPDIADLAKGSGVQRAYRYWVGVTPSCPVQSITVAGIDFPKVNENLIMDPSGTNKMVRSPVIGAIVFLDEVRVRLLRERLPLTIIRFTEEKSELGEPLRSVVDGQTIGDAHRQPRRGHVITIHGKEEIEQRRKDGTGFNPYVPGPNDVPAARFMFAQLCEDQEHGSRSDYYPEVLEETGLEWPEELAKK